MFLTYDTTDIVEFDWSLLGDNHISIAVTWPLTPLQNMGCLCLWLMMSFLRARYFDLLLGSPRYHKCKVKWWCWGRRCPWKSKKCLRYNYVNIGKTEISDFKVLLIVTWWHSVVFCIGANYSFHKEKAKPAEPITPVVSKV